MSADCGSRGGRGFEPPLSPSLRLVRTGLATSANAAERLRALGAIRESRKRPAAIVSPEGKKEDVEVVASPPTGTVTFLFTDIEGSTRMWERSPEAMSEALARHDRILRSAIEAQGGYVFKTVGDAFCCAFTTAPEALEAALLPPRPRARGLREEWAAWEGCWDGSRGSSRAGTP